LLLGTIKRHRQCEVEGGVGCICTHSLVAEHAVANTTDATTRMVASTVSAMALLPRASLEHNNLISQAPKDTQDLEFKMPLGHN